MSISSKIANFGKGASDTEGAEYTEFQPEEGMTSSAFTRKEVTAMESWEQFGKVDSTVETFVPSEIKDSNGLYFRKLMEIAKEQNSSIVAESKLGWEFKVVSDKLGTFSFDGVMYYYDKEGVDSFKMDFIESGLIAGEVVNVKLNKDGVFYLTPQQSSKIMGRFAKFNPVIKETSTGVFDIVIGELK